jgi:hypothetical protein
MLSLAFLRAPFGFTAGREHSMTQATGSGADALAGGSEGGWEVLGKSL